jgi:hypothetical protein
MLATYRPLFKSTLARRLVATSLTARLAVGMTPLPLVLTVRDATGSYALAGLVSGGWSLGVAVSAPFGAGWWTGSGRAARCRRSPS